ncbi:MAG: hypothetical protein IJI26_00150 [Clostridia bacterium]|nr:hypothetical protein [Clostridia bacterium]
MTSIILSVVAGAVLCAFHVMRIRETERTLKAEMQRALREEQKAHQQFVSVLCDYILQLSMERDAASEKAEASYKRGRIDHGREMQEAGQFVKAFEGQRVHYALREVQK